MTDKIVSKNIYQKLICVQEEMPKIEKTKLVDAGARKYKHVKLNKFLEVALPILRKYGIYHHSVCVNGNLWRITLTDSDSGEQITSDVPLIGAVDMQKAGSAITYAGRYGLFGLLGICPDIDDDGQKACDPEPVKPALVLSTSERNKLTFDLHELWKIKEGVVRAEESMWGRKAVGMFADDFQGVPDESLVKLKKWISEL